MRANKSSLGEPNKRTIASQPTLGNKSPSQNRPSHPKSIKHPPTFVDLEVNTRTHTHTHTESPDPRTRHPSPFSQFGPYLWVPRFHWVYPSQLPPQTDGNRQCFENAGFWGVPRLSGASKQMDAQESQRLPGVLLVNPLGQENQWGDHRTS